MIFILCGSAMIYSTYLGGSGNDEGYGMAVDRAGNDYVTGYTISTDFPTMNPLQPANGGYSDAFVTKFNPTGSALIYSTYLGGSGSENNFYPQAPFVAKAGIAVAGTANAYATRSPDSTNFPTI